MYKKLYLTSVVPELQQSQQKQQEALESVPPDIQHKLMSHKEEKKEMTNIPPHIRPQPLIKYSSNKWSRTVNLPAAVAAAVAAGAQQQVPAAPAPAVSVSSSSSSREPLPALTPEKRKEEEEAIEEALGQLPYSLDRKARKLAPYLYKIRPRHQEFSNLLYDLVSGAKTMRTRQPGLLDEVIAQLETDPSVPRNMYLVRGTPPSPGKPLSSSRKGAGKKTASDEGANNWI